MLKLEQKVETFKIYKLFSKAGWNEKKSISNAILNNKCYKVEIEYNGVLSRM